MHIQIIDRLMDLMMLDVRSLMEWQFMGNVHIHTYKFIYYESIS